MTCHKDCPDCDCGNAMNNLDSSSPPTLAIGACQDCGEKHNPRPCIECVQCSRLFTMKQVEIDADCEYWCRGCFDQMLRDTETEEDREAERIDRAYDDEVDA